MQKLFINHLNQAYPEVGIKVPTNTLFHLFDDLTRSTDPYFVEMIEVKTNSQYFALDLFTSTKFWRFAYLAVFVARDALIQLSDPQCPIYTIVETESPLCEIPVRTEKPLIK